MTSQKPDSAQIRGALGLLRWENLDLAKACGVSAQTISNIKLGTTKPHPRILNNILRVFDEQGIEFIDHSGVRLKPKGIERYEGQGANQKLLDDVYRTLRDTGGEVLISGLDEKLVIEDVGKSFLESHLARLEKSNITERLLVKEGDTNFIGPVHCYRWIPVQYFSPYPAYVYGPKIALVSWAPSPRCAIIHDEAFAESTRKLFNFVWSKAQMHGKASTKRK